MFRNAYPARMMRKTSVPIMRAHHWGFMSLRPIPPLSSQQLISFKEVCLGICQLSAVFVCLSVCLAIFLSVRCECLVAISLPPPPHRRSQLGVQK